MLVRRFGLGILLGAMLLTGAMGVMNPARAQSDAELQALYQRATALYTAGKYAEAIPFAEAYAEAAKTRYGENDPQFAVALNNVAQLLKSTNRPAEAERFYRRALAINEKSLGPEHPTVATGLHNLAALLYVTNRLTEAEPLMRRALAIDEKAYGPDHPSVALRLNNLAQLLNHTNQLPAAEPLMRRALVIHEKAYGPDHPAIATDLNNLAQLLQDTNRVAEAEALMRRTLAIDEKSLGPEHPTVAASLHNLAALLYVSNRLTEAEPLMRRALAIDEKAYGPDHPSVALRLNSLAQLLQDTNRLTEAEPLMLRVLAIDERSLGPEHPSVARDLHNLASLLQSTNRLLAAEPLMRRALAIDEKSFGPEHPNVAMRLDNLAGLRAELGDWAEAAGLHRRAKPIVTGARWQASGDQSGLSKVALTQNRWSLRAAARALHRASGNSAEAREEGFELAQWALQTGAANALVQMSARFAKGSGPLAALMRERQDLVTRRQGEDKLLLNAIGQADAKAAETIRRSIGDLDKILDAIGKRLTAEFPEYSSLADPRPLTIAAVQGMLKTDEALVFFLDVPRFGRLPEETLAWAMTRNEVRWIRIAFGTAALAERVAKLRCGLDLEGLWSWSGQRWEANGATCRALKPAGLGVNEPLPFDLGTAHELYTALLGPFADLTAGKHLIVVPSGPLTSLPFHVLVTKMAPNASDTKGLPPSWLVLQQPISVLPAVGSLLALRKLPPSEAKEPYIAFGNPLLDGSEPDKARADQARAKQRCLSSPPSVRGRVAAALRGIPALGTRLRGSAVDLATLRVQAPLPETADELCAVANALGALGRESDTVWLGARATETNLKALSRDGKLARHRVLHFATHGLLAGETEAIVKDKAEPALMLTPPRDGASPAELEQDDGLLTASEVAQLNLDADWVVLSACNTAAGDKGDAEALSGLARAFFYAKARALLVSHWYVNSDAAVKLTIGAFAELHADPKIGRAEALRRSMVALITKGRPEEAHPEYWAPFVPVGEGRD
jgi:CHAT domain-containing protein